MEHQVQLKRKAGKDDNETEQTGDRGEQIRFCLGGLRRSKCCFYCVVFLCVSVCSCTPLSDHQHVDILYLVRCVCCTLGVFCWDLWLLLALLLQACKESGEIVFKPMMAVHGVS